MAILNIIALKCVYGSTRLRQVSITPELIGSWVKNPRELATVKVSGNPLPLDAAVVGCFLEALGSEPNAPQTLHLVFKSDDFGEIKDGVNIPDHGPIEFEKLNISGGGQ